MSVAGLRYNPDRATSAPLETKSGSYIYNGDAQSFHDWQFRTLLRCKLFDQSQAQSVDADTSGADSFELPDPEPYEEDVPTTEATPAAKAAAAKPAATPPLQAGTPKSARSLKGSKPPDRSPLVNKVVEGLRGDAFLIARDMGLEFLIVPGGIERLVELVRQNVFPRATEEAKELFRMGQRQGGPFSRQSGESMLSFTQR